MATVAFTQQTFTTMFGNAILGFYIDWTSPEFSNYVQSTSTLQCDITLNLYSAVFSTSDNGNVDALNAAGAYPFVFYLSFLNSQIIGSTDAADDAFAFDQVQGSLDFTTTDEASNGGSVDTLLVDWTTGTELTENHCADALCASVTTDSLGSDGAGAATWTFTPTTDGQMCVEQWTTDSGVSVICNRVQFQMTRPFFYDDDTTGSGNREDINIELARYNLNVGWTLNAFATEPQKMDFAAQVVDFATFITDPEIYTGAYYQLGLMGAATAFLTLQAF